MEEKTRYYIGRPNAKELIIVIGIRGYDLMTGLSFYNPPRISPGKELHVNITGKLIKDIMYNRYANNILNHVKKYQPNTVLSMFKNEPLVTELNINLEDIISSKKYEPKNIYKESGALC